MTGGVTAEDGINWIEKLCCDLQVPQLSAIGITEPNFSAVVETSKNASSMKGNPVDLFGDQLTWILQEAL